MDIEQLAERVDDAARNASAIAQLSAEAELPLPDAYRVQAASVARRLGRGERRTGIKMGFTSRAKMVQMGIGTMIWGRLTSGMAVEEGGEIVLSRYVHPRVEPEVAFLLRRPLAGPVTLPEAAAAVEAVAPAMEIIDSRYRDFKFSLGDVVADNSSSSGYCVGPWSAPDVDTANLGLVMVFDGRAVQIGSTAAILGHPLRSLAAAAAFAGAAGEDLPAGAIVLAGGATTAEPLRAGVHVRLEMERLGAVAFRVAG